MELDEAAAAIEHILAQPRNASEVDENAWHSARDLAAWAKRQVKRIRRDVQSAHNSILEFDEAWLKELGFTQNEDEPFVELKGIHHTVTYHAGRVTVDENAPEDGMVSIHRLVERGQMLDLLSALDMMPSEQPSKS